LGGSVWPLNLRADPGDQVARVEYVAVVGPASATVRYDIGAGFVPFDGLHIESESEAAMRKPRFAGGAQQNIVVA
jgi:hypothetical protein